MSTLEIVILALIQGLTEFLPISSSAHLILPSAILGWDNQGLAFDVAVHVGSLAAVMIYFREELVRLAIGWGQSVSGHKQSDEGYLAWWVILATIPAIACGFTFKDYIELYLRAPEVIAATTICFGLLLWYADRTGRRLLSEQQMGWRRALIIGLSQALALIPGTSRSGITMTTGLMAGLTREAAARFSFLLSIPVIAGAGVLLTLDLLENPAQVDWRALFWGTLLSFFAAYTCISLFLTWISRIGMGPFVLYRLALGFVLIGIIGWG